VAILNHVALQHRHLIAGQRRFDEGARDPADHQPHRVRDEEGQRHERARALNLLGREAQDFLERECPRPAEFIRLALRVGA